MQFKRKPTTYLTYATIYDDVKGDRSETIELLKEFIRKHNPNAKTLLDLACGTGGIAKGLVNSYSITGLDASTEMLKIAKKKLPHNLFVQAGMADFKLIQKFDVVYCLHNSVNHLLTFSEWEAMFKNVKNHLNKGGLFIFDINPIEKMKLHAQEGISTRKIKDNYVMTEVTQDVISPELYHWDVKIFLKQKHKRYILQHEEIKVSTYPIEEVKKVLYKNFDVLYCSTLSNASKAEDIGRAYFVVSAR